MLSFNYDVLVELAWLDQHGKSHRPWSDLYAVPVTPSGSRFGTVLMDVPPTDGLRLLKLHGSLNWFYSGPGSPPGDPLYDGGVTGGWSVAGVASTFEPFHVVDKLPFIVPPTAVKSPYYGNQGLQTQWRMGADALRNADEVVIMGLGVPATDLLVGSLLATTVQPNDTVIPVNIDGGVVTRLQHLLEPSGPHAPASSQVIDTFAGISDPMATWVSRNV